MAETREPASLIKIFFDGGAKPTNPGPIYGSYEVFSAGKSILRERNFDLGHGTNNEAEFGALERAVCSILRSLIRGGLDPRVFTVHIYTDSTVLRDRISGRTKRMKSDAEKRMAECSYRITSLLGNFTAFTCTWQERSSNVKRFGH